MYMRYVIGFYFVLSVCACSKSKTPAEVKALSKPSSCVATGSGLHDFQNWPEEQTTTYDCPSADLPNMDCTYYEGAEHTEMQCMTQVGLSQGRPTECSSLVASGIGNPLIGMRPITASDYYTSEVYDCGVQYNLRCVYIKYGNTGVSYEDIRCTDDELP